MFEEIVKGLLEEHREMKREKTEQGRLRRVANIMALVESLKIYLIADREDFVQSEGGAPASPAYLERV